jgi:4-amino-4-deoxy-L-arabinose transferase-like glycosyltransferase
LFTAPLSKEVSWLLPFGIFSAIVLAVSTRLRWPFAPGHQAIVLWGGWLMAGGVFFSVAGFFHEYYLSTLAPPVAALVGIGLVTAWRLLERHRELAIAFLLVAVGTTLALQITTARAFVNLPSFPTFVVGLLGTGVSLLVVAALISSHRAAVIAGLAFVVGAMLLTPGVWSALTALNSSENQSLPSSFSGRVSGPPNRGGSRVDYALLDYLEPRTKDTAYLMAVPSSMQGADYVIATKSPVLYLGGFSGQDRVLTVDALARLIADGQLRFIYWGDNARGGPAGGQPEISAWVSANCVPVDGFDIVTRNAGAPDGTGRGSPGQGDMRAVLRDCRP